MLRRDLPGQDAAVLEKRMPDVGGFAGRCFDGVCCAIYWSQR